MNKEDSLRKRALKGKVCLNWQCAKREHCLLWLMCAYLPNDTSVVTCVNPKNKEVAKGNCPYYLSDERVMMAKGMVGFYDEMPRKMEEPIKGLLIAQYGRTIYYEYRNGVRLISPKMQAFIKEICLHCGWTQEPKYDEVEEDYAWD